MAFVHIGEKKNDALLCGALTQRGSKRHKTLPADKLQSSCWYNFVFKSDKHPASLDHAGWHANDFLTQISSFQKRPEYVESAIGQEGEHRPSGKEGQPSFHHHDLMGREKVLRVCTNGLMHKHSREFTSQRGEIKGQLLTEDRSLLASWLAQTHTVTDGRLQTALGLSLLHALAPGFSGHLSTGRNPETPHLISPKGRERGRLYATPVLHLHTCFITVAVAWLPGDS